MNNDEILKLRNLYGIAQSNVIAVINEAYSRGVPWFMIDAILENARYQVKLMLEAESKSTPPQENHEPTPAIEETGEQDTNE